MKSKRMVIVEAGGRIVFILIGCGMGYAAYLCQNRIDASGTFMFGIISMIFLLVGILGREGTNQDGEG